MVASPREAAGAHPARKENDRRTKNPPAVARTPAVMVFLVLASAIPAAPLGTRPADVTLVAVADLDGEPGDELLSLASDETGRRFTLRAHRAEDGSAVWSRELGSVIERYAEHRSRLHGTVFDLVDIGGGQRGIAVVHAEPGDTPNRHVGYATGLQLSLLAGATGATMWSAGFDLPAAFQRQFCQPPELNAGAWETHVHAMPDADGDGHEDVLLLVRLGSWMGVCAAVADIFLAEGPALVVTASGRTGAEVDRFLEPRELIVRPVGDLNRDGRSDLIGYQQGYLQASTTDGTLLWTLFPITGDSAVVAELDGDPATTELLFGYGFDVPRDDDQLGGGNITALDGEGRTMWRLDRFGSSPSVWTLGDADGDAVDDLFVEACYPGCDALTLAAVSGRNGVPLWSLSWPFYGTTRTSTHTVGCCDDLDGDGVGDVWYQQATSGEGDPSDPANWSRFHAARSGRDGSLVWQTPAEIGYERLPRRYRARGDLNGNGSHDLVDAVMPDDRNVLLRMYDGFSGEQAWAHTFPAPGAWWIGDTIQAKRPDGQAVLIIGVNGSFPALVDCRIHGMDADGLAWSWPSCE